MHFFSLNRSNIPSVPQIKSNSARLRSLTLSTSLLAQALCLVLTTAGGKQRYILFSLSLSLSLSLRAPETMEPLRSDLQKCLEASSHCIVLSSFLSTLRPGQLAGQLTCCLYIPYTGSSDAGSGTWRINVFRAARFVDSLTYLPLSLYWTSRLWMASAGRR